MGGCYRFTGHHGGDEEGEMADLPGSKYSPWSGLESLVVRVVATLLIMLLGFASSHASSPSIIMWTYASSEVPSNIWNTESCRRLRR
jgi:hypothetical protein